MDYQTFNEIFNRFVFGTSKAKLLENIAENPERYLGIFRPTKPKTKLLQNLLTSHEIKFGDAFEYLIEEYLKEHNFSPLSKKIPYYNKDKEKMESLELDQFAKKDNTYYFIEQKMRDDHDSAKKRGQVDNFKRKLEALIYLCSKNTQVQGYFYFIDESLKKNQNYYKEELQKLSVGYGVPLNLCYGKELFENLNILQAWDEVLNHLARWRETLPDLPSLNFDENPSESFQEIKDLAPSVYRKLLDNDGIFNLVLILFPEQKVLKKLAEYFRQQNKTIYQQLASKLEERLSSIQNHQKPLS
ncbi:HpyAIV family type II restriction enzyme [Helicobacter pylori]|uniref:HpyAIV family type II restriction enzyme n=1 Tax=Helicobacter pylori TaxID=210 RepID=UPI00192425CE|nr:restriction endonuclease [Helicobacter pylori]QQX48696.1 restriction endonuclease [Helicobacter pylori]